MTSINGTMLSPVSAMMWQAKYNRIRTPLKFYYDNYMYPGDLHDIIADLNSKYSPYPIIIKPYRQYYDYPYPKIIPRYVDWKSAMPYGVGNNYGDNNQGTVFSVNNYTRPAFLINRDTSNYSSYYNT